MGFEVISPPPSTNSRLHHSNLEQQKSKNVPEHFPYREKNIFSHSFLQQTWRDDKDRPPNSSSVVSCEFIECSESTVQRLFFCFDKTLGKHFGVKTENEKQKPLAPDLTYGEDDEDNNFTCNGSRSNTLQYSEKAHQSQKWKSTALDIIVKSLLKTKLQNAEQLNLLLKYSGNM